MIKYRRIVPSILRVSASCRSRTLSAALSQRRESSAIDFATDQLHRRTLRSTTSIAVDPDSSSPLCALFVPPTGQKLLVEISPKELMKGLQLAPRDLRFVDSSSSRGTINAIIVRQKAVLIRLQQFSAIIAESGAYIFNAESSALKSFLQSVSGDLQHFEYFERNLAFTIRMVDLILRSIARDCEQRLVVLQPIVSSVLKHMEVRPQSSEDALVRLLNIEDALTHFAFIITELLSALADIRNLKQWTQGAEVDQASSIFRYHMIVLEEIQNEVKQISHRILVTRQSLDLALDVFRNKLMKLSMHVSFITAALSFAALITSLFGMNIVSGLEETNGAFMIVICSMTGLSVLSYIAMLAPYWKTMRPSRRVRKAQISSAYFNKLNSVAYIQQLYSHLYGSGGVLSADHWEKVFKVCVGMRWEVRQDERYVRRQHEFVMDESEYKALVKQILVDTEKTEEMQSVMPLIQSNS